MRGLRHNIEQGQHAKDHGELKWINLKNEEGKKGVGGGFK